MAGACAALIRPSRNASNVSTRSVLEHPGISDERRPGPRPQPERRADLRRLVVQQLRVPDDRPGQPGRGLVALRRDPPGWEFDHQQLRQPGVPALLGAEPRADEGVPLPLDRLAHVFDRTRHRGRPGGWM